MTEPEQWRFQWPDGTWIRWNPHTQSWEKETASDEGVHQVVDPAPDEAPIEEESPLGGEDPIAEDPPVAAEDPIADETPSADDDDRFYVTPRIVARPARGRRPMVGDVLPPSGEPERPGGSLWPTILTGMVVGLGVGLLIWNMIR